MTKQEKTGKRDLTFSGWIRKNLPDSSTGFMVSDIDFFVYNYKTKRCAVVEIKTRGFELKTWQKRMYDMICRWIGNGVDNGWKFYGFYFIKFENTFFDDGNVYLNNAISCEKEIINKLSLKD